jgi:transglutaminase-like putative cysteine protease
MSDDERQLSVGHLLLELLWVALVILAPLLGVWTASSLAAYLNGPVWLAALAGLLLFPILPGGWEAWAVARRRKKPDTGTRWLNLWDRLALRTLAVNGLFLAALLLRFPAATFEALSTRGDWFLEGRGGDGVDRLRSDLFATANRLEWLYRLVRPNPYEQEIDPAEQEQPVPENPVAQDTRAPEPPPRPIVPEPPQRPTGPQAIEADPVVGARRPDGTPLWPLPPTLHPLVASLPPEAERSIDSVARYIAERESDPWMRVKALHDYVADRIAYDADAYRRREFGNQDAPTVFQRRMGVCAGYANLLAALAKVTGDDVRVVPGDARVDGTDLAGEGHAWNAARIGEAWVLIDATWDAGSVGPEGFKKSYGTDYLFAPPEIQGVTHFPEDERWQLREPPLTRGEFFRQPVLRPRFFADGLRLVSPDRSQVTVSGAAELALDNPRGRYLMAKTQRDGSSAESECQVSYDRQDARIRCALAEEGSYRVRLYSNREEFGRYQWLAELFVQNRAD